MEEVWFINHPSKQTETGANGPCGPWRASMELNHESVKWPEGQYRNMITRCIFMYTKSICRDKYGREILYQPPEGIGE